jgi:large subunit ribosomal protein L24
MKKIRKGDQVIVIAGNDKGKTGEVLQVLANDRVVVSGVAVAKKHTKPNPAKNIVGGILDKNLPIHISNVAIYNSETKKADRVGIKKEEQGQKTRVFKSNGKQVG